MPSQQEVQWSQLKVGVLVIVALARAHSADLPDVRQHRRPLYRQDRHLRSYFENAAGLKVGAPVNLEGVHHRQL